MPRRVDNVEDFAAARARRGVREVGSERGQSIDGSRDALHDPGMDERVIRLEGWVKRLDQRMGRMEGALDRIEGQLDRIDVQPAELPTKRELTNSTLAGLGFGLALMALFGGIAGGLSYFRQDGPAPTSPPPVIITAAHPQSIYMQPPALPALQLARPQR